MSHVLPLDLRLRLALGEAAHKGDLTWTELDQTLTTLERLDEVDRTRWQLIYDRLAPPDEDVYRLARSA